MGLEVPGPGIATFQTMFLSWLHSVTVFSALEPMPVGPRNCGQSFVSAPLAGAVDAPVFDDVALLFDAAPFAGLPSPLAVAPSPHATEPLTNTLNDAAEMKRRVERMRWLLGDSSDEKLRGPISPKEWCRCKESETRNAA